MILILRLLVILIMVIIEVRAMRLIVLIQMVINLSIQLTITLGVAVILTVSVAITAITTVAEVTVSVTSVTTITLAVTRTIRVTTFGRDIRQHDLYLLRDIDYLSHLLKRLLAERAIRLHTTDNEQTHIALFDDSICVRYQTYRRRIHHDVFIFFPQLSD